MNISFFYEHGEIREIGTGHKYRSMEIERELVRRGHSITNDDQADVIIIDHINSQKEYILRSRVDNKKIVLIDGEEEDAWLADVSISAFYNKNAQYTGVEYIVFPTNNSKDKYKNAYSKEPIAFVGLGGYDANDYIKFVIDALTELNIGAVVAKSINYDYTKYYKPGSKVSVYSENNYFEAMKNCTFAITNGGLTMFQALHYGMPCIAIPQYDHQKLNINESCFAIESAPNKNALVKNINMLLDDRELCDRLGQSSREFIDGKGTMRVCDLIENM
jgi:spore coat polysaccharide biosynthesis predicted glycosyltransferase SpsG